MNVCRNPVCSNFSIRPKDEVKLGGNSKNIDSYILGGSWQRRGEKQFLVCKFCKETISLQSNLAIDQEARRYLAPFSLCTRLACPCSDCDNANRDVSAEPTEYFRFGTTKAGSQRFRCKKCNTTFSKATRSTLRQRLPQKTPLIFRLLINKSPMRRICEVADIGPETLYQRIDFIHRQCTALARQHEQALFDGRFRVNRIHLAVDRQDHVLNWGSHLDRRNIVLRAIASADAKSGYVLGVHLNYDPTVDPQEAELEARECGDFEVAMPFRKFARIWLPSDYSAQNASESTDSLLGRMPSTGVQVREDANQYAHFFFLERLLRGADRIQFSMDQEPSVRAACLLAFQDRLRARTLDAFFVRINKDMTVDEKKLALSRAEVQLRQHAAEFSELSDLHIALELIKRDHAKAVASNPKWRDRWVSHPLPNMNEPEKAILCLTDTGDYDPDLLARAYARVSLNAIDRFFMLVRRRVSLFERPISSSSRAGRRWFGYHGYNPHVTMKMLEIFRVAYNYCLTGDLKSTPAQRFGLTTKAWTLEEVLAFRQTA